MDKKLDKLVEEANEILRYDKDSLPYLILERLAQKSELLGFTTAGGIMGLN